MARRGWLCDRSICVVLIGAAITLAPASARATDSSEPLPSCTLEPGPIRTVTRVQDGETVTLDDGSEVRLIGALAPRARDADAEAGTWPLENAAVDALKTLVLGHTVKLAFGGQRSDRYGRAIAHLFAENNGESLWVQGEMLKLGYARVYGLFDNFACARELLAHEKLARDAHIGVWALSLYGRKPASLVRMLNPLRSQFQLVAGKVQNVSRTKSAVYLNFGDDWKTDFTARIGKSVISKNSAWAANLEALKGQDIEIRGWIERRNGPMIDVVDPAQIESIGPLPSTPPADAPNSAGTNSEPETSSMPSPPGDKVVIPRAKQKRPEPRVPDAENL